MNQQGTSRTENQTLTVPIAGMDCADCVRHVQHAIAGLEGVESVDVYLGSEKAIVRLDPTLVDLSRIRRAVEDVGYSAPDAESPVPTPSASNYGPVHLARRAATLLAIVVGVVLFVVVVGEWLGLFEHLTERVPWPIGVGIVLVGGWPIYVKVVRAALKGQVLSHTLMVLGVLAASGLLPPILAAAAQSLPDLGILGNSSRLLRAGHDSHR